MSTADSLSRNQADIEDEMERHAKEMSRLLSEHDGLIGEIEQELADEKQRSRDEGFDEGTEAEREGETQ
jgi:hypothetical protein